MTFREWLDKFPWNQFFENGYGEIVPKELVLEYAGGVTIIETGITEYYFDNEVKIYSSGSASMTDNNGEENRLPAKDWCPVDSNYVKENLDQIVCFWGS